MKKFFLCGLIFVFLAACCVFAVSKNNNRKPVSSNFVRIHIRANSNLEEDQNVKMLIKENLIEFLTPLICDCSTIEKAKNIVASNIEEIERVANEVLKANNFFYSAHARLSKEEFPTRSYGEFELEKGIYSALIVELGEAKGENWWCVVFPPLCFVGGENNGSNSVRYKSKIIEIIESFMHWVLTKIILKIIVFSVISFWVVWTRL